MNPRRLNYKKYRFKLKSLQLHNSALTGIAIDFMNEYCHETKEVQASTLINELIHNQQNLKNSKIIKIRKMKISSNDKHDKYSYFTIISKINFNERN